MMYLRAVIASAGLSPTVSLSCNSFPILHFNTTLILIESSEDMIWSFIKHGCLRIVIATKRTHRQGSQNSIAHSQSIGALLVLFRYQSLARLQMQARLLHEREL